MLQGFHLSFLQKPWNSPQSFYWHGNFSAMSKKGTQSRWLGYQTVQKICQTSRNLTVCLTTTFCQKLEKMEHMHGFGRSSDDSEIVNTYIETQVTHCEHKYQSAGCKVHALVSRQPTICDDSRANNCIFCRHATTKAGQDVPGSLISPFLSISLLHTSATPSSVTWYTQVGWGK